MAETKLTIRAASIEIEGELSEAARKRLAKLIGDLLAPAPEAAGEDGAASDADPEKRNP